MKISIPLTPYLQICGMTVVSAGCVWIKIASLFLYEFNFINLILVKGKFIIMLFMFRIYHLRNDL